ncbi:helix-turn-helix transcriptional regulator [Kitasatospora sp. Ki12]
MPSLEVNPRRTYDADHLAPANGFWIHDERLVIVEDWHAELWLDQPENVSLYLRVWETLAASAVYGADAHKVITRCRRALGDL